MKETFPNNLIKKIEILKKLENPDVNLKLNKDEIKILLSMWNKLHNALDEYDKMIVLINCSKKDVLDQIQHAKKILDINKKKDNK